MVYIISYKPVHILSLCKQVMNSSFMQLYIHIYMVTIVDSTGTGLYRNLPNKINYIGTQNISICVAI